MDTAASEGIWRDDGRVWVFGKDISSWPRQKLARAIKHKADLESQFVQWVNGYPLTPERIISDDRLRWQTRLKVFDPPPVAEWSLALGDSVHALRSALDSCVWEFAHIEGSTPPQPRKLQFPIVRTRSGWLRARTEQLQTVPKDVADRIERMQPFNRAPAEVDRDALICLSYLDNVDKHRSNIRVSLACDNITMNMTVKWEEAGAAKRNIPPRVVAYASDIVDGAVIMQLDSLDRIEEVEGGAGLGIRPQVETPTGPQNPFELLPTLINYVQSLLDGMTGGLRGVGGEEDSGEASEGWMPLNFQQEGNTFRTGPSAE
jgi:hypothetical protein